MKPFIKEIIANAAMLSALIVLPIAFLGPGWTRSNPEPFQASHGRITAEQSDQSGESLSSEEAQTSRRNGDRFIPILQAFKNDERGR